MQGLTEAPEVTSSGAVSDLIQYITVIKGMGVLTAAIHVLPMLRLLLLQF